MADELGDLLDPDDMIAQVTCFSRGPGMPGRLLTSFHREREPP
jgi:hypothetical protein